MLWFGRVDPMAGLVVVALLLGGSVCPGGCAVGEYEAEYSALLDRVEDRVGLQAIKLLHQQLDDDKDGTIEPFETGDFIKADLKFDGDNRRETLFHHKDAEITVSDLWLTWSHSEVYNWTVQQTVDWLSYNVDLPQYAPNFKNEKINGSMLPLLATSDTSFLTKRLGIKNPIHKSKITLKAMDVVLFGPPKEPNNLLKDIIVAMLVVALISALTWAYQQKKRSELELSKMIKDMESLNKAEQMLQEMQARMDKTEHGQKDQQYSSNHLSQGNSLTGTGGGDEEVDRLREEVDILRAELHRAEIELEDRCWVAPTILQHWLQLTYELECKFFNEKRRSADSQMTIAKDACEKLKKKRSSIVGAFVSTHGRSIDDVDKSILEAKTALLELTHDLTERSRRWRQIEMLTGVSIISNPGLITLQKIVRYVGGGNKNSMRSSANTAMSSRMSNMSLDELNDRDDDARSLAASSHVSSHMSSATRYSSKLRSGGGGIEMPTAMHRRAAFEMSSKESTSNGESSDDQGSHVQHLPGTTAPGNNKFMGLKPRNSQTSMSSEASSSTRHSQISSGGAASAVSNHIAAETSKVPNSPAVTVAATPAVASAAVTVTNLRSGTPPPPGGSPGSSGGAASRLQRAARMIKSLSQDSETEPVIIDHPMMTSSISDSALASNHMMHRATKVNQSILDEIEESCSASDSGSLCDIDGKKQKKKKSFFNFRRKKDKVETIS
jgi:stromal interaction molecule 1